MPLVLTAGAPTASGLSYADIPGVRHEFPRRYIKLMVPGTPFVYYRGTRARLIGLTGPAYFGCGVVGPISETEQGLLRSDILDYVEFPDALSFRTPDGDYLEPAASTRPIYFQQGIRAIDEDSFKRILQLGLPRATAVPSRLGGESEYARSPSDITLVDEYAVGAVVDLLSARHGSDTVTIMPHNNPWFDLLLRVSGQLERHVEVKGTRSHSPVFFLTEGERIHSQEQSATFSLIVVYAIDLGREEHKVAEYEGAITDREFLLEPRQWQVRPRST